MRSRTSMPTKRHPMTASTADTRMYATMDEKYHTTKSTAAVAAAPTMNLVSVCEVTVMSARFYESLRSERSRAMGVCDPITGSPISTNSSLSLGMSTSTREPNLMNPASLFCVTASPGFM